MDTTNSGVTDDQELAKVLESMNQQTSTVPAVPDTPLPAADAPVTPPTLPAADSSNEFESIKKSALEELRPLVNRLDLPAEEKFDTLLLIIRSTDDKSLVTDAHEAAKAITDETKRAQALLDVIKEIDYFSGNGANPAA